VVNDNRDRAFIPLGVFQAQSGKLPRSDRTRTD